MRLLRPAICLVVLLAPLFHAFEGASAAVHRVPRQSQSSSPKNGSTKSSPAVSQSGRSGAGKTPAKKKSRPRRPRAQLAPTADRLREIQSALARDGFYKTQPSGKWDTASTEAMKRFQTAQGLQPTGKLDARSLQALGLGSQIAGIAAPAVTAAPGAAAPGAASPNSRLPNSSSPNRQTPPSAPNSAPSNPPPPDSF